MGGQLGGWNIEIKANSASVDNNEMNEMKLIKLFSYQIFLLKKSPWTKVYLPNYIIVAKLTGMFACQEKSGMVWMLECLACFS